MGMPLEVPLGKPSRGCCPCIFCGPKMPAGLVGTLRRGTGGDTTPYVNEWKTICSLCN